MRLSCPEIQARATEFAKEWKDDSRQTTCKVFAVPDNQPSERILGRHRNTVRTNAPFPASQEDPARITNGFSDARILEGKTFRSTDKAPQSSRIYQEQPELFFM